MVSGRGRDHEVEEDHHHIVHLAIYGIDYLKPALVYVVVTVALLLVFLLVAYPLVVALGAKQNPITFIKKIANVAVFGFSTSSSAATLPLNIKVCTEDFGVDESIASSAALSTLGAAAWAAAGAAASIPAADAKAPAFKKLRRDILFSFIPESPLFP